MILEGEKCPRIPPGDYISHLQRLEGENNILAARKVNDLIINWVKDSIFRQDPLKERNKIFTFFVYTASVMLSS
jgi:hypothetical protein